MLSAANVTSPIQNDYSFNKHLFFNSFSDIFNGKTFTKARTSIFNSTKPNWKQQAQFTLRAIHGLHELRGLNTNTLDPGDLSEPSVIVYVWIGSQGLYQPFMSFFFFRDIFSGRRLNQWLSRQERNVKREIKQTERKAVCVKDLEVEIENAWRQKKA